VAARPVSVKAKRCPRWIQPAGSRVVAELARIQVVIEAVSLQQTRVAPMLHDLPTLRAIHPAVCARIDRRDGLHNLRRAGRGTPVAPDHALSCVSRTMLRHWATSVASCGVVSTVCAAGHGARRACSAAATSVGASERSSRRGMPRARSALARNELLNGIFPRRLAGCAHCGGHALVLGCMTCPERAHPSSGSQPDLAPASPSDGS
jgi:hypothetical protein